MELTARLRISIQSQLRPDDDFLNTLSDVDQIIAIKACLLTWEVSRNFDTQICPRPWQIEDILTSINNTNSLSTSALDKVGRVTSILRQHSHKLEIAGRIEPDQRFFALH